MPFFRGTRYALIDGKDDYPRLGAVTTAPSQTVTIQEWNATAATLIDWGDGQTTNQPANTGTTVSHVYAVVGTYTIRMIVSPLVVTRIDFRDMALFPDTRYLRGCRNLTYLILYNLPNATVTVNTADLAGMPLTRFDLYYLPNATGVVNTADLAGMPLTYLTLNYLPNATVTVNTADLAGMPLTYLYLSALSNAAWTIGPISFAAMTTCDLSYNSFTQAQVDAVLQGLYSAFATRTAAGGTIDVSGNNAAPSGVLGPECPPDPGNPCAYELAHDSCLTNPTHTWATVTVTL